MKRLSLFCQTALALAALTASAANPAPAQFQVKVLDPAGQALAGAVVERYGYLEFMTGPLSDADARLEERRTTDAAGLVTFTVTNRTGFAVVAGKPGLSFGWFTYYQRSFRSLVASGLDGQVFELALTAPESASGTVRDQAGKPVSDAVVVVNLASRLSSEAAANSGNVLLPSLARQVFNARTDAEGRFRIENLPADATFVLTARKAGLAPEAAPGSGSLETLGSRAGQSNIVMVLKPGGAVEGRVVQEEGGAPVSGALISISQNPRSGTGFVWDSVTAGADGGFRLCDVPAGDYVLKASETSPFPAWVCDTVEVSIEAGKTNRDLKLAAGRGGLVDVTVRGESNDQPIPGAYVLVAQTSSGNAPKITSVMTSEHGAGRLRLAPGQYQVGVVAEGHNPYESRLTVEAGQTNQVSATLGAAAQLAGIVLDSDGKPAARIPVTIPQFGQFSRRTDNEGRFTFDSASRFGGSQRPASILIAQDAARNLAVASESDLEATNAVLRLEPALVLAGRITDAQGKPLTNGTATLLFHMESSGSSFGAPARTDAQGRFEVKALPRAQHYSLTASAPGYGQSYRDLPADETSGPRIDLGGFDLPVADRRIAGIVVDDDEKPVAGASVSSQGSQSDPQPRLNARTDSKGRFAFDHVVAGSIQLSANSQRDNSYSYGNVSAESGDTNIVIQLRNNGEISSSGSSTTRLSGTVTDPDGKPAPKVELVMVSPYGSSGPVKATDAEGRFRLGYSALSRGGGMPAPVLVARDAARNLAGELNLDEETTNVTIKLEPGLILAGRAADAQGKPLSSAEAHLVFHTDRMSISFGSPVHTDAEGKFEFKGLPRNRRYAVTVSAKNYGQEQHEVQTQDTSGARMELEAFQLAAADQRIAGIVTDEDDKPVAGAYVNVSGTKQSPQNTTTDRKGHFTFKNISTGDVQLSANRPQGLAYGNTTAQAGDTNITIQLSAGGYASSSTSRRISGTITGPDGKPAAKVTVFAFPNQQSQKSTDAEGRFKLLFNPNQYGSSQDLVVLIARDPAHNLAAALEVDSDATNADIKLEPALTLAGRVTDSQGKPIANADAYVMFHTEHMGSTIDTTVHSAADGKFELKGLPRNRRYTVTVSARNFGQDHHEMQSGETGGPRLEMEVFELAVADQRLAGIVTDADDKPVANVSVNLSGDKQTSQNISTDRKGHFAFSHVSAGTVRLYVYSNGGGGSANTTVEAGDTNITVQLSVSGRSGSSGTSKLVGTVTDTDGKPAPKATVLLFPYNDGEQRTDGEGRFKLFFDPNRFGNSANVRVLVARDLARNLAAALEVETDATNAEVRLEPGVTVSGRVVDPQGKGIAGAEAQIMVRAGNYGSSLGQPVHADANGRYELKTLPAGRRYDVYLSAKGFGRETVNADLTDVSTNSSGGPALQLDPVELLVADQRIAGVVLNANDKPVAQAYVSMYGSRQPNTSIQTDSKGRFAFNNVCAGQIQLSANDQHGDGYASLKVEAGDTNITIQLRSSSSSSRSVSVAQPVKLKGKPLPDLTALGLTASDVPAENPVVVLLIDAEQRPSRRTLKVLTDQADALKEKHVAVIILQAGAMADAAYASWLQDAALPFPIARLKDTSEKGHAAWGAAALPWLILTDKTHKVAAEGFTPDELDAKLKALGQ